MSRKLEYGFLAVFSIILLVAGGYLFQTWAKYHEAALEYQKLQKYRIEKTDKGTVEADGSKILCRLILTGFVQSMRTLWRGYRFRELV